MAYWVAKYKPDDVEFYDDVILGIQGDEDGFIIINGEGEDIGVYPMMTENEAIETIRERFEVYSTFQWLEDD